MNENHYHFYGDLRQAEVYSRRSRRMKKDKEVKRRRFVLVFFGNT
jgi:hypothetical protein